MTLENAFQELIADNAEWYKLLAMSEDEAKDFTSSFVESRTGELEVRKVLIYAGYQLKESWSKLLPPKIQQDAPKRGIVVGDPTKP